MENEGKAAKEEKAKARRGIINKRVALLVSPML